MGQLLGAPIPIVDLALEAGTYLTLDPIDLGKSALAYIA
jgi:hypothetical protein